MQLGDNQLERIPLEIDRMTALTELWVSRRPPARLGQVDVFAQVDQNKLSEFPTGVLALTQLLDLKVRRRTAIRSLLTRAVSWMAIWSSRSHQRSAA